MKSILFVIEHGFYKKLQINLLITNIGKLLLERICTRHMILSIINLDSINLQASSDISIIPKKKANLIVYTAEINFKKKLNKLPKYALAWSKSDDMENDNITIASLGLLPTLVIELMKVNQSLPFSIKDISSITDKIRIVLIDIKKLYLKNLVSISEVIYPQFTKSRIQHFSSSFDYSSNIQKYITLCEIINCTH
jgi:hypothetical protein